MINSLPLELLAAARVQLHYAIQLVAATGAALAEPLPDDSHTSLEWFPDLQVFAGPLIRTTHPFRVALDPVQLTVMVLDRHDTTIATLALGGKTLTDSLSWLKQAITDLGTKADSVVFLTYPPNDFPDHPLAHGAPFDAEQTAARSELTAYYALTDSLLREITASMPEASTIHIWPHHFDMATLITLPGRKQGSPLTVGVGMSPGDHYYPDPYWYVSPYPVPQLDALPVLAAGGVWHTQHWTGAVLTASRLSPEENTPIATPLVEWAERQIALFLRSTIKTATTSLLNGS